MSAGRDTLLEIRGQVLELDGCKARVEELVIEEERQERTLAIREKQITEEISETLRKRKEEIGAAFQEEEEKLRARQKKLKIKKERYKNGRMSERIEAETAGLAEENDQLRAEAKSAFRQSHTPQILNTAAYYSLFMPKNLSEYLTCLLTLLVLFTAVPVGVYYLLPDPKGWYWILIYLGAILLFGGGYVLIHNYTKANYTDALIKGRRLRSRILLNKRAISKIRRQIERDKDESIYGLEQFDEEIEAVQQELEEMIQRRKDAMNYFEGTTKTAIIEEIRGRNQAELERMRDEHEATYQELKATQDKVKQKTLYVAENYEAFLGREFVSATVLDRLLEQMEQGKADTIGTALALYKEEGSV